jgi:hypothetical protein
VGALALEVTWTSVLVGLGAVMAGAGSVLSGIAALRTASKAPEKEVKDESPT